MHTEPCSGRPSTRTENRMLVDIVKLLVTLDKILAQLPANFQTSQISIGRTVSDVLGFQKVCELWVPLCCLKNKIEENTAVYKLLDTYAGRKEVI